MSLMTLFTVLLISLTARRPWKPVSCLRQRLCTCPCCCCCCFLTPPFPSHHSCSRSRPECLEQSQSRCYGLEERGLSSWYAQVSLAKRHVLPYTRPTGTFLSKAAQANLVMQTIQTKSVCLLPKPFTWLLTHPPSFAQIEAINTVLTNPLLRWSRDDVRAAKEQSKNYKALHQTYTDSVYEVKKINSKQSVPLNVLQKVRLIFI